MNKKKEVLLWEYLVKKLGNLNDNNKVAKEIFNYITKAKEGL